MATHSLPEELSELNSADINGLDHLLEKIPAVDAQDDDKPFGAYCEMVKKETEKKNPKGRVERVDLINPDTPHLRGESVRDALLAALDAAGSPNKRRKSGTASSFPWQENLYNFIAIGHVGHHSYYGILFEETEGETDLKKLWVPVPVAQLNRFHDPSVDWLSHAHSAGTDLSAPTGRTATVNGHTVHFHTPFCDPRYVIHLVKNHLPKKKKEAQEDAPAAPVAEPAKPPPTTKKRPAKKPETGPRGDYDTITVPAIEHALAHLEGHSPTGPLSVYMESTPGALDRVKAALGEDKFPVLRSDLADGIHALPLDFVPDIQAMYDQSIELALARESQAPAVGEEWNTTALMQAFIINGMQSQMFSQPACQYLNDSGRAWNDEYNEVFSDQWKNDHKANTALGQTFHAIWKANQLVHHLVDDANPLLQRSKDMYAFSRVVMRIGSIKEYTAPVPLHCALTSTVIRPGQAFILIHGRGVVTDAYPQGQQMMATVAKCCRMAECSFAPVAAPPPAPPTKNPKKKMEKPAKPPKVLSDKPRNIAKRERREKLKKEVKPTDEEEEEVPVPVANKKKTKAAPEEEQVENHSSPKKRKHKTTATPKPHVAAHPTLTAFGQALVVDPLFLSLAQLATSDVAVNKAILATSDAAIKQAILEADTLLTTLPDTGLLKWGKSGKEGDTSLATILIFLISTACAFIKPVNSLSDEQRAQLGDTAPVSNELLDDFELSIYKEIGIAPAAAPLAPLTDHAILGEILKLRSNKNAHEVGRYYAALATLPLPLKVPAILEAFKPVAGGTESAAKARLGQLIACFHWLFPTA